MMARARGCGQLDGPASVQVRRGAGPPARGAGRVRRRARRRVRLCAGGRVRWRTETRRDGSARPGGSGPAGACGTPSRRHGGGSPLGHRLPHCRRRRRRSHARGRVSGPGRPGPSLRPDATAAPARPPAPLGSRDAAATGFAAERPHSPLAETPLLFLIPFDLIVPVVRRLRSSKALKKTRLRAMSSKYILWRPLVAWGGAHSTCEEELWAASGRTIYMLSGTLGQQWMQHRRNQHPGRQCSTGTWG